MEQNTFKTLCHTCDRTKYGSISVLGWSAGSEAVVGVWHCLVLFGRQSSSCCRQIIHRYMRSLHIHHRIPIWSTGSCGDGQHDLLFWFWVSESKFCIWFCSSTSGHFLAVLIPTHHYVCLLLPLSMHIEAGYCQYWLPGVQEMPQKWLSQIWHIQHQTLSALSVY